MPVLPKYRIQTPANTPGKERADMIPEKMVGLAVGQKFPDRYG